jgi:hypothetical protein
MESRSRFRQFNTSWCANKEALTDFAFQCFYRSAKRWLLNTEPLRGPRDVAFLCHRQEITQMPQLHASYLSGIENASWIS